MRSHRALPPLALYPRGSWRLAILVGVTHGLAGAAALALPLGWWRFPLLLLIALGAAHDVLVHVLRRAPWSIRSVHWQSDGIDDGLDDGVGDGRHGLWVLTLTSGAEVEARMSSATFVSLPLVVLNFRVGWWRHYSLPLFADALDPEQLRRLRQRLRIVGADLGGG